MIAKRSEAADFDIVISVMLRRLIVARKAVGIARAAVAECDADAAAAGLCLRTLRLASRKACMTPADQKLDTAADRYVSAMESVTFGGVTDCVPPGALLRGQVRAELVTPQTDQPT